MPELIVNLTSIHNNAEIIVKLCKSSNISVCGVVKGCNALPNVIDTIIDAGCYSIGTSRLDQMKAIQAKNNKIPLWNLRIPSIRLCDEIVECTDVSLVSELDTLFALNNSAKFYKKKYQTILMIDIGDLREGWWPAASLLELAPVFKKLDNIEILGIGTNFSCYGSVVPTYENTKPIVDISNSLSNLLNQQFKINSGGNTTSLRLILNNNMPFGITNLRIGEAILLGRDLSDLWHMPIEGIKTDTFTLRAEIIELKSKPSYPQGEMYVDAFANSPKFVDRGIRRRALLYVGKADFFDPKLLVPKESGIEVLGASSDHLIVDVEDYSGNLKIGDVLEFELFYGALLGLTNSADVNITYK